MLIKCKIVATQNETNSLDASLDTLTGEIFNISKNTIFDSIVVKESKFPISKNDMGWFVKNEKDLDIIQAITQ